MTQFSPWESCTTRSCAAWTTGTSCITSGKPRSNPRLRHRRAAAGRLTGRRCTDRRTHCIMLIPTTMSLVWITSSGIAPFGWSWPRNKTPDRPTLSSRTLESNQEWVDLDLLLSELNELGARPILLSMPLHGGWYDRLGINDIVRSAYYQKLRAIGTRHDAAVFDFADHEADQSFCHDNMGHLAPGGWVYYSEVLDGLYRDKLPRQPDLPARAPVASRGSGGKKR